MQEFSRAEIEQELKKRGELRKRRAKLVRVVDRVDVVKQRSKSMNRGAADARSEIKRFVKRLRAKTRVDQGGGALDKVIDFIGGMTKREAARLGGLGRR